MNVLVGLFRCYCVVALAISISIKGDGFRDDPRLTRGGENLNAATNDQDGTDTLTDMEAGITSSDVTSPSKNSRNHFRRQGNYNVTEIVGDVGTIIISRPSANGITIQVSSNGDAPAVAAANTNNGNLQMVIASNANSIPFASHKEEHEAKFNSLLCVADCKMAEIMVFQMKSQNVPSAILNMPLAGKPFTYATMTDWCRENCGEDSGNPTATVVDPLPVVPQPNVASPIPAMAIVTLPEPTAEPPLETTAESTTSLSSVKVTKTTAAASVPIVTRKPIQLGSVTTTSPPKTTHVTSIIPEATPTAATTPVPPTKDSESKEKAEKIPNSEIARYKEDLPVAVQTSEFEMKSPGMFPHSQPKLTTFHYPHFPLRQKNVKRRPRKFRKGKIRNWKEAEGVPPPARGSAVAFKPSKEKPSRLMLYGRRAIKSLFTKLSEESEEELNLRGKSRDNQHSDEKGRNGTRQKEKSRRGSYEEEDFVDFDEDGERQTKECEGGMAGTEPFEDYEDREGESNTNISEFLRRISKILLTKGPRLLRNVVCDGKQYRRLMAHARRRYGGEF